jgi:hypothetical protein
MVTNNRNKTCIVAGSVFTWVRFKAVNETTRIKMKMFVTLDKAKPDIENIRGLNLAVVMCTTVQVSELPW